MPPLRTAIARLAILAITALLVLVLADLVMVRGPQFAVKALETDAVWLTLWAVSTMGVWVGTFLVLLAHQTDSGHEASMVRPVLLSAALTAVWFAIAIIAVVNTHLVVGGRL